MQARARRFRGGILLKTWTSFQAVGGLSSDVEHLAGCRASRRRRRMWRIRGADRAGGANWLSPPELVKSQLYYFRGKGLMLPSIFLFEDYRIYLLTVTRIYPRGFKTRMAELIGCEKSYITQIFRGRADLTCEQAECLQAVLFHDELAADYFLTLVELARAKTPALRRRLKLRIRRHQELSARPCRA